MKTNIARRTARRAAAAAIIAIALVPIGFLGWIIWSIKASYRDYEQVFSCLEQHGFKAETGWQHKDLFLEDFGVTFQLADGQSVQIQILDGYAPRDCESPVAGMFISGEGFAAVGKPFLRFDQPTLVADLDGTQMRTMGDAITRLDWLLEWASAHPESFVDADGAGDRTQYFNLISPPL